MNWKIVSKKHKLEPIYEVTWQSMSDLDYYSRNNITDNEVFLNLEEAIEAARKVAYDSAWFRQLRLLDEPNCGLEKHGQLAIVYYGRKYSKKGTIYGFGKVVYVISDMTEEMTKNAIMDKRVAKYEINEYTEQPVLTKDMFYQWED